MLVDDHPMLVRALEADLTEAGFEVVATASDGDAAVRIAAATRPDVVLLDLQLPGLSGVEACRAMVAAEHGSRVLILSASAERSDVLEAVKAGASGYLVKTATAAELSAAVGQIADGDSVFTPGLAGLLLGEYRRLADPRAGEPAGVSLTERETEVLRATAKGLTARQVANRLGVSPRTVSNHLGNAMTKLQVHSRAELVRYAIESGLDAGTATGEGQ